MSILKLSKNDIIRNGDSEDKIKLKRSNLSFDSAMVSGWEQTNRESLDILNDYNNRINKSEWLDEEDRKKYRSALDSYIETSNNLRGINKTFGEGYSDEDEQKWADSIASMNAAYDSTEKYYSQWIDEKDYKGQRDGWFQKSNLFDDGYQFGDITQTIGATITDAAQHVGAGIIGIGEAALDGLMTIAPYIAQGQYYANGGGYNIQASQAFDQSIQASKKGVSEFVAKDLYDEGAVAKAIIAEPVKALTGIDAEVDSVFGEKTDSLGQSAGQLVGTAGLQAVGVPWWLTTGVTSLGSESQNALNQGATLDEAAFSGLVSAGAEILTEKISGGISFGGKTLDDVLPKLTAKISNKVVRTIADLGIDMIGEGGEEVLSGAMSAIGQKLSYASDKELSELFSSEEALDSFIGGAVLGLGGSVVGNVKKTIDSNKQAKNIYGDNIQDLLIESAEIGGENTALVDKLTAKYGKKGTLSGYDINRLVEANESALVSQDKGRMKAATEARLAELGESGDVSKLADVIVKAQSGEKLTSSERNILVNSKYGRRVSTELNPESIESGEYASKWAEGIGTERINTEAYNRGVTEASEAVTEPTETNVVTENVTVKETSVEGESKASVGDAKNATNTVAKATMVDGEGNEVEAKVAKIADVENGEASLELEDGKTVKASEVDFGDSGIGLVYKAATEMVSGVGGFNVDAANLMVKGFNPSGSIQAAGAYVSGFNEAYRYGAMGYPVSELSRGVETSKLSEKQREAAYNLGKAYGNEKVAEKQAKIDSTVSIKAGKDSIMATKKGKVYFDGSAVGKTLTERQKASLKGLRVIAEGMGVNIHIFESKVVDGKRQGANGWYDPVKKEIHLDLHAGVDGNGVMLFTVAHELTHHIREVAPAKFKMFADALLEEYTKNGVSLDDLIAKKIEQLERNKQITPNMTEEQIHDLAYEEVVADSAEAMLVDSGAIEALSRKIQAKDKGLWERIRDFIAKLVNRIKAAYEGLDPDSAEGKTVRDMMTSAEKLQQLWVDALLEASDIVLADNGIVVDSKTESASLYSVRDLLDSDQQQKVSKALAERFGVTQAEAMDWLKAETSLASLILNPKYSQYLDYTGDPDEVAIKTNSDYPQGTVDFSNICKKRRDFTEVMNRVLRNFPNHVFAATDLAKIRTIMEQEGMEVACAICYVEDRRQLDSVVAQDFIDSLKIYREGGKVRPDGKPFNANQLKAFSLIEGDTYTPSIYELISLVGRNSLKAKNPAMEEAWVKFNNARGMQSVRLLLNDAEYKRQILKYSPSVVARKNDYGGLRIYSFSDMEMFHLIDIIQVITDSATVGLSLQGYTKVNEYAKAVKDTGEKLNRSLIPKGDLGYHMEGGRVVLDFDTVEGIDINHPDFFDNIDNPNIGNIVIGINATQIKAAMASKFIDQIIPFHTGQSGEVLGEKGIAAWENYKDFQSERDVKTQKKSSHQINIYTEVINAAEAEGKPIKNKVEFVNKFLEVCKENNLIPRFSEFLNVDENGNYVYTEGYHKFLVDFKTFDQNTGEYLPQMPVKPIFDNEYITGLLTDYVKSQKAKDAEIAKSMPRVIERITNEIVKPEDVKYSLRDSSYSYEALTSKPDMILTTVDGNVPTNRADVVAEAKKNAAKVGKVNPKDGSVSVRVEDIGVDVILGKDGLKHSLDRRMSENAPVVVKAGEIISNSIRINELNPRKAEVDESYVLIGAAKDANGELYIVRSVVNRLSNELTTMDVLYAINAKKENRLRSMRPRFQHLVTDSTISIAQLLDFVNEYFPDILPESVLRHYGYTERPSGTLGESALYQDRDPDSYSNRSLLAGALETAAQNDIERQRLRQYKQKIDLINAEEQKLHDLRAQIKELSFAKGKRDTEAIKKLQFEANQAANRINTYDKQLLNLESTKALKGVLEREKALARKRDAQKYKEAQERYREKAAKTQRELMDRYQESRKKATEGRNKTAMRYKIKGIVSELNTLLLKPTAKKHIKEELRKEVADALSAINMDTVGADERVAMYNGLIAKEKNPDVITELTKTRDRIQLQGDSLKEKLGNLQSAYEKIKNTDDIELNLAYQEVIQNSIKAVSEKVGNTSIRNMTLEQLEMVYDLFKMIRHTIRDANKSFKEKKGQTIMQMAEAVNDQVRTVGGQPYKRNAISAEIQRAGWTFLKPYVAFRTIGSITLTNMYKELRNGEDTFYGDVKEAQAFVEAQYKKHGYKSWDMKKTKTFTAKSGKSFDLTLEQMMTLYAYSKRDQAHDHIIQGGIVFEDALVTEKNKWGIPIKYEVTTKDAFNLSEETFKEICDYLEKEHKDAAAFVNEMQAYLSDTMGAKGNEVSMELLGVKLFKEKFYLPIKSSQYYMNFKAEEAGEVKLKSPAFSKETVQHANNPIVVHNFTDLWAEHINDMSMYHSFVLALEDFTRVYNYKTKTDAKVETMDTKATLETAYPGVTNYINKFLKDMNGGVRGETVGWAEKLTSLSKKGSVLGSASVTIQQPSAVMRAMAYINPKYFVTTAHQSINLAKHKADWAELKQYAPIAGIKEMGRFDVGMGQGTVDWIKSDKTVLEKGEDILSMPPAFMDEVTWLTIWNAVKRETVHKNPGLATSSEEFLKLAGERFTEVISMTQVYDSVFSRSDLMRNKSWIAKSLTAFMAEPSTTLNMLWDSWVQGKRTGSKKGFVKATTTTGGAIVAATVFNAVLKSIISAMRDDDEDESYIEKYLEHLAGELKDNTNPLTLIPYGKDIVSIFQGYDVERMDMTLFSNFAEAWDAMDSDSKTLYEKWSGLIGAISAFFGVPVKNVERDVRGLITTVFGETEETTTEGMINAIKEGWTGKEISKGNQLYDAYLKGDSAQIKRIEGRFKDQSAIDTAIRKALRENDPRIKEAAEAYLGGDYATYNNLRDEIVAEGNYSRTLITDALKAEYNYLKKKAEENE